MATPTFEHDFKQLQVDSSRSRSSAGLDDTFQNDWNRIQRNREEINTSSSKYQDILLLGSGAFGEVWKVMDPITKLMFADKRVLKSKFNKNRINFPDINEVDLLNKLDHKHILKAKDFFFENNIFHLIMPLAPMDLKQYMRSEHQLSEYRRIMYEIVSALHFLHLQGYYHCDIKPSNILMFERLEKNKNLDFLMPVLSDLGLVYPEDNQIKFCGTPGYMSPQCLHNSDKIRFQNEDYRMIADYPCDGKQSDIFSLGAVFYEMIERKKLIDPFNHDDYPNVEKRIQDTIKNEPLELKKQLLECIYKMCRANPTYRLQNIEQVLEQPCFNMPEFKKHIMGSVKVPKIPLDVCNKKIEGESMQDLFQYTLKGCIEIALSNQQSVINYTNVNLRELCIIPGLILRCLQLYKTNNIFELMIAILYLAGHVSGTTSQKPSEYIRMFANHGVDVSDISEKNTESLIKDCLLYLEGCVSFPTIYNYTDNGLECFWYLLLCLKNCNFVFRDPSQLHIEYLKIENDFLAQHSFPKISMITSVKLKAAVPKFDIIFSREDSREDSNTFELSVFFNQQDKFQVYFVDELKRLVR